MGFAPPFCAHEVSCWTLWACVVSTRGAGWTLFGGRSSSCCFVLPFDCDLHEDRQSGAGAGCSSPHAFGAAQVAPLFCLTLGGLKEEPCISIGHTLCLECVCSFVVQDRVVVGGGQFLLERKAYGKSQHFITHVF